MDSHFRRQRGGIQVTRMGQTQRVFVVRLFKQAIQFYLQNNGKQINRVSGAGI